MYAITQSSQFKSWWHLDADGSPTQVILLNSEQSAVQAIVDQLNETAILRQRIKELEAQLVELTAPKPVICDQCKMPIEGVVHTRHGLDDSYTLCGACVTENED